jgi:squalene-hopene/tetraprenyl-beta-curcumene cyclase
MSSVATALAPQAVTAGAEAAIARAVDYLFSVQRADGSWLDHLPSSPIGSSVALVALYHADRVRYAELLEQGCAWLRLAQGPDGGWGDAIGDRSTINASAIALAVLKLIDPTRSSGAVSRGLAFLDRQGGLEVLADKRRCSLFIFAQPFMAMAGLYPWEKVYRMPLLPILLPLRLQQSMAFTLPGMFAFGLMHARMKPTSWLRRLFVRLVTPRILAWLRSIQAVDGGYEESIMLCGCIYIGLHLAGVGADIADGCLAYVLQNRRPEGAWPVCRDLAFAASNYVLMGLDAAGYIDHPRLRPTVAWMLASQWTEPFHPTGCPAGGWGWSLPSGWPDTDDTSMAVANLPRMGVPVDDPHIRRGCGWLLTMQNTDGSWGCFLKDSQFRLEAPCPGFTAHAVIGLHTAGFSAGHAAIRRALDYFARVQRPDGSIHSTWWRDYVAGTAGVLDAYAALGQAGEAVPRRCIGWLLANQNEDGSWGGSRGVPGTVEETAWALAALVAAGVPANDERMARAAAWLVACQQPNGSWIPSVIGVYFTGLFYSDDQIANGSALQALGRYRSARERQWMAERN